MFVRLKPKCALWRPTSLQFAASRHAGRSYIKGCTSAAVNLRDPVGASIVSISPPNEERRKVQEGRDVFKHQVKPSIDPENYKLPTVGAVLDKDEAPNTATARP